MSYVSIVGIDPGQVHTGCVELFLEPLVREIDVSYRIIRGTSVQDVRTFVCARPVTALFIEDYNPSNYAREDKKMSEALGRLKAEFPPSDDPIVRYIDNAGVNTLIPVEVQKLFGVHKFPVSTHHNDLNSAGKIALLGMLKDNGGVLRPLVSQVVQDALDGAPWAVKVHG